MSVTGLLWMLDARTPDAARAELERTKARAECRMGVVPNVVQAGEKAAALLGITASANLAAWAVLVGVNDVT